jgi:TPR repeat protein
MGQMPPLDDVNGDRVLAEFEAMIRDTAGTEAHPRPSGDGRGLVPERRAVNWVNALAALAREIEQRQGRRRAEVLLRTVGSRMCRELLTPPPNSIETFEPAINRALSILDWGWVAVLDRQDAIVFEHRVPWPFEKRLEHLPYVLEGFFSDLLQRLGDSAAMPVRLTGQQGGALQFQWSPSEAAASGADAAEASIMMPAPIPDADEEMLHHEPWLGESPAKTVSGPRMAWQNPDAPARPMRQSQSVGARRLVLVAATVLVALFAAGAIGVGGAGGWLQHLRGSSPATGTPLTAANIEDRAAAGDTDAQIRLGLQLANGAAAKPDYTGAARWFQVAAKSGSLEAEYDLAVMTADGLGVKRDLGRAAVLFMSAAAGGLPQAEYRVGVACQYGAGVPRSPSFAAMWYERAARHGVGAAQKALAALYAVGNGVPVNPVMAFAWYRVAEEQGDRVASVKRIELYSDMTTTQRAAAMAQAKILLGTVNSTGSSVSEPTHPTVDTLIAQAS